MYTQLSEPRLSKLIKLVQHVCECALVFIVRRQLSKVVTATSKFRQEELATAKYWFALSHTATIAEEEHLFNYFQQKWWSARGRCQSNLMVLQWFLQQIQSKYHMQVEDAFFQ